MTAIILKADGTELTVHPKNGFDFTLKELQQVVGGYAEKVNIFRHGIHTKENLLYMFVNEDGIALCLPLNRNASKLCPVPNSIFGDVLVCATNQIK